MKRTIRTGVVLTGLVIAIGIGHRLFDSAAAAQGAQQRAAAPIFEMNDSWLKVPPKWKLGGVSSVAVDAQDHVWVLHRVRTLPADQQAMAAPPVLEFDAEGNFIQGWGGPAAGYEWPEREHGIHVDYKGNVWIGGNNCPARNLPGLKPVSDDQLVKFTKAGKFVMQSGQSNKSGGNADTKNFRNPSDIVVYQKTNEAFVADGYGNHRVIVLNADTGAFKRMWGAFGNKPLDNVKCPPPPPPAVPNDGSRGPEQFEIVHAIRVSNDGLVYVGDREHKRVQVFTIDGKYVNQQFIGRETPDVTRTAGSLALSADPQQQFVYVGGGSQITVLNRKTLEVVGAIKGSSPHHMASDSKGNIYTAELAGQVRKFVFKGVSSPATR